MLCVLLWQSLRFDFNNLNYCEENLCSRGKHRSKSVSVFTGWFTPSARPFVACNVLISRCFADEFGHLVSDFAAVAVEDVVVIGAGEDGEDFGLAR